ncbi:MAG: N-acetylmuramoyl-L-alanine amidase [Gemmobacter sp.]|nr:N-acetylmuramoyl-L-alanine amidase [Gemmobacter sp.]
MSKADTILIQTGLRGFGFAPGPVDGLPGPKTQAAALAWLDAGMRAVAVAPDPVTSAVILQGSARHPVTEIALHCSATRPDWMAGQSLVAKRAEIRRWHLANGWSDIGYHWLVDRNGTISAGRAETVIGAGIAGHNAGVIHICLIGGHGSSETDRFSQHFTSAQGISLRQLMQGIGMRTRITRISGHNEYAAKACPGFTVSHWLNEAA